MQTIGPIAVPIDGKHYHMSLVVAAAIRQAETREKLIELFNEFAPEVRFIHRDRVHRYLLRLEL